MSKVVWFSAGVSSAVATHLALKDDPSTKVIYIDIDNQHPDSTRFVKDCESYFNREILTLKSPYGGIERVIRQFKYINGPYGARCTMILKKRVRQMWELENSPTHYIWGMDNSKREIARAARLRESMPKFTHTFPLIEAGITKVQAHGIVSSWGISRPAMYDLGYPNNNCVGCVKGGMGYWNKIRVDFPDVFKSMALLEREIGASCIKETYLDQLDPLRGRNIKIIVPDCGQYCESN